MATYARIKEVNQNFNIMGGALHPKCIYLIAEEVFDENKHGKTDDEWSFKGDFNIYLYKPLLMEKSNDWQGSYYAHTGGMTPIVTVPDKDVAFLGCISTSGTIYSRYSSEGKASEFQVTRNGLVARGRINDLSVIDEEIYACSSGGAVYQYISDDNWQEIALETTERFFSDSNFSNGFNSIGGFSADEIYAGGGDGILWLRDKGSWRPIDLPINEDIEQIVCSPDGNVYLRCHRQLIKGRMDSWEILNVEETSASGLAKIAWFNNNLYVLPMYASAVGLFELKGESLKHVQVGNVAIDEAPITGVVSDNSDNGVFIPGGNNEMVANDELLMITGDSEVILFNGERWFNLFDKNRTEEELRATGTFYDPREL